MNGEYDLFEIRQTEAVCGERLLWDEKKLWRN